MKTLLIIVAILAGFGFGYNDYLRRGEEKTKDDRIKNLEFQHTRDSLVIDSLRNPVDTTEFLTEHSELVKVE